MKKSTKIFASAAAVVAMFIGMNSASAQTQPVNDGDSKALRLGVGVSAGIPTNDDYNIALGADLRLQKDFFSNISGTLSAGYTNFSVKDESKTALGYDSKGWIPVKAGIKIFPVSRFYISGEVGAAFGTDKGQGTALVYAPGIGVGTNTGIDIGLRYEGIAKDNINFPKS
ncbi:MAG: hypothetical protein H7Y07_07860, partial [Pyrinomonadaceae bacterium]|nr:hypothetical protein [Sphingobacteriaceae bacterium]